jgi:hypothetical protein
MSDAHPPSVLINGDFAISPWVTQERAARQGMLLVWREGDELPEPMRQLADSAAEHGLSHIIVRFRQFPELEPLRIRYAAIPPSAEPRD